MKVFIAAGEYSGDILAAELASDLAAFYRNQAISFEAFGITGPAMRDAGVQSVADITELSVMGFLEVLTKLGQLSLLDKYIVGQIERLRPDVVILVDNPGFSFRMAEQLKLRQIPVVQYVAPKVWAWGKKRVEYLKRDFDLVLGILPFEEKFFLDHGVRYKFIGCPIKDRMASINPNMSLDKKDFKKQLRLDPAAKLLALLPGSRRSELRYIAPVVADVVRRLRRSDDQLNIAIPVAVNLDFQEWLHSLARMFDEAQIDYVEEGHAVLRSMQIHVLRGQSLEVMAAADAAMVASGTATLECGLLQTPMAVVYRMSETTYSIAKGKVTIPYISLVNLLVGDALVKEFIQEFTADQVLTELKLLLSDTPERRRMLEGLAQMTQSLAGQASKQAVREIAGLLAARKSAKEVNLA